MYIYPLTLPAFSNREDILLTLSVFDDITGLPINLMPVTMAIPGAPFTSNAWTVTDGAIVTHSTTSITIPTFPYGNQLSALSLTVGLGLAIAPGDLVVIADTATGLNTMTGYAISYNSQNGALVVQIGVTLEFEIRSARQNFTGGLDDGYGLNVGPGVYDDTQPIITAQLGNGLSIVDVGYIQILIPALKVQQLRNNTYLASMTMTDSINTRQIEVGDLPIIYGGTSPNPAQSPGNQAWANIF